MLSLYTCMIQKLYCKSHNIWIVNVLWWVGGNLVLNKLLQIWFNTFLNLNIPTYISKSMTFGDVPELLLNKLKKNTLSKVVCHNVWSGRSSISLLSTMYISHWFSARRRLNQSALSLVTRCWPTTRGFWRATNCPSMISRQQTYRPGGDNL